MRKYYWYISIFFRKHGAVVIGSIVAAVIVFSLGFPFLIRLFELKKTVYIGMIGRYRITELPLSIQQEISSGLTKLQADNSVVPSLSERWVTSDDGKTYRFVLKKNDVWQDGQPVTTSDVNYQFENVSLKPTDNDIVFQLQNPFAPFPGLVSQPLLRFVDQPYLFFFKQKRVIGIGPNELTHYTEHNQYVDELTVTTATQREIYRFYLTEDDAVSALKRGEIDVLNDVADPHDLMSWPNMTVSKQLDPASYVAIFFNTEDDLLKSNDVRQALNYALPKPSDNTRAVGPINPQSWAFADVGKHYDFDQQRAIDRIVNDQSIPHQPMHIDLTTTPLFLDDANAAKTAWETFGQKATAACQQSTQVKDKTFCDNLRLQVDIHITNFPDTSNFQALLIGEQSSIDPDQYPLWHSSSPLNFTHYKNIRIDSLLEQGRQTTDPKKRFEIYSNFQQFFSDDAPAIFIRHLTRYEIRRNGH